jgi:arsenate reductase
VHASDVVVLMGCDDPCLIFPGKRYGDWKLHDSAGEGIESAKSPRVFLQ